MPSIVERVENLESRLIRLLYAVRALEAGETASWHLFVIQNDMNEDQVSGLCGALEAAQQRLFNGKELSPEEFEKMLEPFIPEKQRPLDIAYEFIKGLLMEPEVSGKWPDVFRRFRLDYNVQPHHIRKAWRESARP